MSCSRPRGQILRGHKARCHEAEARYYEVEALTSLNTMLVQNNSNSNPNPNSNPNLNTKTARQTAVKLPNDGGF